MKLIFKILEILLMVIGIGLILYVLIIANSLHFIPQKKHHEILLFGRNLLVSEILLFLFYNYLYEKPKPMQTLINFIEKVKSGDFFSPLMVLLTFLSIYYTFGFIYVYQDKDLGFFYGILYYFGIALGFVSIASFTYLTFTYPNADIDEDLGLLKDPDTNDETES